MTKRGNSLTEEFVTCSRCGHLERVVLPIEISPEQKKDWTMNTTPDIRYMFKTVANQKQMPLDKTLAYLIWLHEQVQLGVLKISPGDATQQTPTGNTGFVNTPKVYSDEELAQGQTQSK